MIKIKVTHPYGNWPLVRQTSRNSGIWGNCQFFINDNIQECDYWFVFDDLLKEEMVVCNPKNIIIITIECPAIRPKINLKFLQQFGTVFTYSREINHPNKIEVLSPLPWHIGVNNTNDFSVSTDYKNYDNFREKSLIEKPKLISVICSNKDFTEGHRKRLRFVEALKNYFGESIDVFGRGINSFADKWDVVSPYKYHIVLENSSCKGYISEKLYDSFLGEAFPFYYGCPNINDYFPSQSFVWIDINDIALSLEIIDSSIKEQVYEKSIQYIQSSKLLVLNDYNIFNLMSSYCTNDLVFQKANKIKSLVKIRPEASFNRFKINNIRNKIKRIFEFG